MIKKISSSECSIDKSFQQSADSSTENQTCPINQAYQIDGPPTQSTITPEEPVMVVESNKIETPITSRSAESQTVYQAINQISDKQPLLTSYLLRSLIHETSNELEAQTTFNKLESGAQLAESIKLDAINEEFDDKLSSIKANYFQVNFKKFHFNRIILGVFDRKL